MGGLLAVVSMKNSKVCRKCGKKFDKKEKFRLKLSLKVESGEKHVWFCKNCSKKLIKLLEEFVRSGGEE